jgi:glycosyltransferase involved in cell wall biosynthesis
MSKILIAIDQLIERNNSTYILEHFLALFPDAHIVTIAHQEGAIGGKTEMAPIYSTYLSGMVKSVEALKQRLPLVPGAINGLKLPEDIKFVISISSGLIHGLNIPGVKHYSYIYEWDYFFTNNTNFILKFFKSFLNNWRSKALENPTLLSFSSKKLAADFGNISTKIIPPFFKSDKIQYDDTIEPLEADKKVVFLVHGDNKELNALIKYYSSQSKKIFILGDNLSKFSQGNVSYMGNLEQENISKYCEHAWLTVDLTSEEFPEFALAAMASGSPVSVLDTKVNREFIGDFDGAYYRTNQDLIELDDIKSKKIDRRKLRRAALKFNGRIFKSRSMRYLSDNNWF